MIGTDVCAVIAARFAADQRAAMGTPIDEDMQRAIIIARDDNGRVPDKARSKVPWLGHFSLKTNIAPGWPSKDSLLLQLVNLRIEEDLIRHLDVALRGPSETSRIIRVQAVHNFTSCLKVIFLSS